MISKLFCTKLFEILTDCNSGFEYILTKFNKKIEKKPPNIDRVARWWAGLEIPEWNFRNFSHFGLLIRYYFSQNFYLFYFFVKLVIFCLNLTNIYLKTEKLNPASESQITENSIWRSAPPAYKYYPVQRCPATTVVHACVVNDGD